MNPPLLQMQNLVIGYPERRLSSAITLEIPVGANVGIIGGNGSGKSSLMKTLLGIIPPLSGHFEWKAKTQFGYVPQENQIDTLFPLSVFDLLKMGLFPHLPRLGKISDSSIQLIDEILEKVEMQRFKNSLLRDLSGGEKQRALIARAMISHPKVLIMDEPFSSLDYSFKERLWKIFTQWQAHEELSLIVIEHDLNRILNQVQWIIILGPQQTIAGPTASVISEKNLSKAYGAPLHVHHEDNFLQVHFL